jgi:hypothetical protein
MPCALDADGPRGGETRTLTGRIDEGQSDGQGLADLARLWRISAEVCLGLFRRGDELRAAGRRNEADRLEDLRAWPWHERLTNYRDGLDRRLMLAMEARGVHGVVIDGKLFVTTCCEIMDDMPDPPSLIVMVEAARVVGL